MCGCAQGRSAFHGAGRGTRSVLPYGKTLVRRLRRRTAAFSFAESGARAAPARGAERLRTGTRRHNGYCLPFGRTAYAAALTLSAFRQRRQNAAAVGIVRIPRFRGRSVKTPKGARHAPCVRQSRTQGHRGFAAMPPQNAARSAARVPRPADFAELRRNRKANTTGKTALSKGIRHFG